ncbi:hypothetical protein D187_009637 [Cystobacter fuscus DSM 2262]|uniref:Lipoprotein n=1 Tax=Cystobacter fuscus (strain ATCC 25194 / DSM 2262 / NBRC 100088 / M29) TaxID=1242864 RepID=S9NW73_CYSF2|nr:hypothetical protein [Cystobacter fuscus]EPX55131.1 hypothetical protein D187_009637 [Cystobacter fuscus DSM 2262]
MKRLALGITLGMSLLAGCDGGEPQPGPGPGPTPSSTVEVTEAITQDTTWKADKVYSLKKYIFVEGGTLTIEAGTKVLGNDGSALVITRNARLNAVGTKDKPIVFTSAREEGSREPGNWGGVVLLGRATINSAGGQNSIEGFVTNSADERTKYGGTDDAHDCGKLKYARIEFAGYQLAPNNELNGLTTGGCGSQTEIDFVQVHKGADDGVEMFGGTANLKHIVITQPDDDGLDYDLGYRGKVQFLVVQQNSKVGNRAIEASGNSSANAATPRSMPEIWNASFIGSSRPVATSGTKQEGLVFNTGAGVKLRNSLVVNFADQAVDVDGAASVAMFEAGSLSIENTFFYSNRGDTTSIPYAANPVKDSAGTVTNPDASRFANDTIFKEPEQFLVAALHNQVVEPKLTASQDLKAPNFAPQAGSLALDAANAATPPAGGFFDTSARFVGAVGTDNWLAGWTAYPEN